MIEFGTGGFRGVIGDDFTRENTETIAQAVCSLIRPAEGKPVVVGYDHRFMSEKFAEWMACVFAANGVKALLYTHAAPSPAVMCATRDLGLDYGVMITASHNPFQFNGVKLFLKGGVDADADFTRDLEKRIAAVSRIERMPYEEAKMRGLVCDFSNLDEYVGHIKAFISPEIGKNSAKILFDNIYGVGVVALSRLAEEFHIGWFDILNKERNALFGGRLPNPTEQNMQLLRDAVLKGNYDYAMATDSDGDRLGILDERGNVVNNNDILACLYYYLVKYRGMKGDIVKNCATSVLVDRVAEKLGYRCHETDVGFKNISSEMIRTDALIGGESSGGLTCRGYLYGKDSAFSASLFMEMRILMKKPVSEIVKEVHAFADYSYTVKERAVELSSLESVNTLLMAQTPQFGREVVQSKHFGRNFKYLFGENCWALFRLSGTEPMLRVFVEAETAAEAERIADCLEDFVKNGGLRHEYARSGERAV